MMQIVKPLGGKVRPCACGRQPFHVHAKGPNEHWLECPPCLVRTARFPMLTLALSAWESSTVSPVALPQDEPNVLRFKRAKVA